MKEFVVYTGMRIGRLLTSLVVVIGVWGLAADEVPVLWAVVLSFVVSGVASYYLLNRQREAFARRVEERAQRVTARIEQAKSKEDTD